LRASVILSGVGGPDVTNLHRKARSALEETLAPGEPMLVVIYGGGGSAMIGTDRRALVFKAGVRSGLAFDHRLKSFEYESVLRVELRRERGMGVVAIHAPLMMAACASYWAIERDNPWTARNAIPVALPDRRVERGVVTLAALVEEFRQAPAAESPERQERGTTPAVRAAPARPRRRRSPPSRR
jgi:hypothetical protein